MQQVRHILVIDDELVSLRILERALQKAGFTVRGFDSGAEAIDHFTTHSFDMVISDYFMPSMGGDEVLRRVRAQDPDVPFIFLTANTDVTVAIELVKSGADDHIVKPVQAEQLVFRVNKCFNEKEQLRTIQQIEQERELLQLENEKLVNWRNLYASKDITQTEQMIQLLSRTINQSGGFLWIDLLKGDMQELDDSHYRVSRDVIDMAIGSAEAQRDIFAYITRIGDIQTVELELSKLPFKSLVSHIREFVQQRMKELPIAAGRLLSFNDLTGTMNGTVQLDVAQVDLIMNELLINALKYSPDGSRILVEIDRNAGHTGENVDISVRNVAVSSQQSDSEGRPVIGIPYDFAERVFDLFYTIEAFPAHAEGEHWRDGTGLYACRSLVKKLGGWIKAGNGLDYTSGTPETFVKVTMTLPYEEAE